MWVNRHGQTLGPAGALTGHLRDVRISPNGSLATVSRFNAADQVYDLMLLDVGRMTASQLTYGTSAFGSAWLPNRFEIVFTTVTTKGQMLVRMAPREGASPLPVIPAGNAGGYMADVSADGRSVVHVSITPDGSSDLYLHSLEKPDEERPLLATPAVETGPRFSPDGTMIAYQSNETGTPDVFIRSFPSGGDKQQASRAEATGPCGVATGRSCSSCRLMAT